MSSYVKTPGLKKLEISVFVIPSCGTKTHIPLFFLYRNVVSAIIIKTEKETTYLNLP